MKIGVKLFLMIALLNLIGTLVPLGIILNFNHKRTTELVNNEISNLSKEHALVIKTWLDSHLAAVRALAQVMDRADKIAPEARRELFSLMVTSGVESESEVIGAGMIWEPNALDGLDAELQNTPGADNTGRFTPYWSKTRQGIQVEALVGYDVPGDGEYYLLPKQTGNELLSGPFLYPIDGVDMFMATVSAPITRNGRFAGVVTRDIGIDIIQRQVEKIKPYTGAVAAVYSNSGIVSGHFDTSRLGKRVQDSEKDIAGTSLQDLLNAIQQGKEFRFTQHVPQLGQEMRFICVPFSVGDGIAPWSLMVGIPTSVISAPLYQSLWVGLGISGGMMIFVFIGAFLMARSISRPIAYTMRELHEISLGDLTRQVNISLKDELGDLARYLNFAVDRINGLVLAIKQDANTLSQTGSELAVNMTQTAVSVDEITTNIRSIMSQTGRQVESVKSTDAAISLVQENIKTLNSQIEKQSDCVNQSSTAVEEMLMNIQQVSQALAASAESMNGLSTAASIGHNGLQEVSGDIQEIARESEGILEINAVMENIASQTNLLSMNAAIEAAHAGEAGKGFAVVAEEIRKLAESSSDQSKTISDVLKKIKGAIDKITKSTEGVLQNFEAIDQGVLQANNHQTHIRNAMEEQSRGSSAILASIESLKDISAEVQKGAREMTAGSQAVSKEAITLGQISQELSSGMEEIAAGAQQIDTAINRVNDISGENKQKIDELMREVNRFKIS